MTGLSTIQPVSFPGSVEDRPTEARRRLEQHAAIWRERPLLRRIYRGYHEMLNTALSAVEGPSIEVGAGHGSFAEFHRDILSCDIVPCPWLDCAADATRLPFAESSLANLVMIDVLHHLAAPARFFAEAERVLRPGGRILMIEPYVSPISWLAWNYFHDEDVDLRACPLSDAPAEPQADLKDPWTANTATPTLLFWRDLAEFRARFPRLSILRRTRFDLLLYPLSGGFERRQLVPQKLTPAVRGLERLLSPLSRGLAFRCFIVLQKKG
ncbi:MAG: class I SAM-dependent methyltransferase [Phycisphaerales bacterium]|nr:class I SAM-dependent methyltransferase [Phycisphaerales bacterium]